MSWMPNWKRQADTFHLVLGYGDQVLPSGKPQSGNQKDWQDLKVPLCTITDPSERCTYRIQVDWSAGEEDEQVALRLQSQLMVTLPPPHDVVGVQMKVVDAETDKKAGWQERGTTSLPSPSDRKKSQQPNAPSWLPERRKKLKKVQTNGTGGEGSGGGGGSATEEKVNVEFKVSKYREPLKVICLSRTQPGSGTAPDGLGLLTRVLDPGSLEKVPHITVTEELLGYTQHWRSLKILSLSGCYLTAVPPEISRLPMLEMLYLDNNKISTLPAEIGQMSHLRLLKVDQNLLSAQNSVPFELRQCEALEELSLEHNKLVRPLLDFRALGKLRVLRLFGNPLEFFPEILPCTNLRHLSLANVRIESDPQLMHVDVDIAAETQSYFGASKHKLGAFFALVFRYSSVHHPLLASALAKICEDSENRAAIGRDESAMRQIVSMVLSDNKHVVEQACLVLSSLAADPTVVLRLMKADVLQAITRLLCSKQTEILVSILRTVASIAFSSDEMSARLLSRETVSILQELSIQRHVMVQKEALTALGCLAFCWENRRILLATVGLRDLLLRLGSANDGGIPIAMSVRRAALRCLAILGENEYLARAVRSSPVPKRGIRILSMDGGGMRGMCTVQMLREIEKGAGKKIHELFDLVCGTSTGGMLAVALGIMKMSLDKCDHVYKELGKLVFTSAKTNESATWQEKLETAYKNGTQHWRVITSGSKHSAHEYERLLKEMLEEEDDTLMIDTATKGGPKVFVVSTLVSVTPAAPFVFRNYQYPPGTPEVPLWTSDGPTQTAGTPAVATPMESQVGPRKAAFVGSCKFRTWEAVRASSAAPYYLDDYASGHNRWQDGAIVANNPSVMAVREARTLWPDLPIDCLVSVGCGLLPPKARGKGGWRLADTGAVLVESACSCDRAEEAFDTFLPFMPDVKYYRINPIDERCDMELDETDPAVWKRLEAATSEYIQATRGVFQELCEHLQPEPPGEERGDAITDHRELSFRDHLGLQAAQMAEKTEPSNPLLGFRRKVLVVEGRRSPEIAKPYRHARALETFCLRRGIKVDFLDCNPGPSDAPFPQPSSSLPPGFPSAQSGPTRASGPAAVAANPSSPAGAAGAGGGGFTSRPVSPRVLSRATSPEMTGRAGQRDQLPSMDLDQAEGGQLGAALRRQSGGMLSPGWGPGSSGLQLSPPAQVLLDRLEGSPHIGLVHLALHCDAQGFILSWRSDIFSVAEPGEMAENFLAQAVESIRAAHRKVSRGRHLARIRNLGELVAAAPRFIMAGALHRFMGRHTQVLPDGAEVGAYLFRRTLPAARITPDDARWMVGAWRDRVVICSGAYGPPPALVEALLDSGAKAVVANSKEAATGYAPPGHWLGSQGSGAFQWSDSRGEDRESGWGDSDGEEDSLNGDEWENASQPGVGGDDTATPADEQDTAEFLSMFYTGMYSGGLDPASSLKKALEVHTRQHYVCHYPR